MCQGDVTQQQGRGVSESESSEGQQWFRVLYTYRVCLLYDLQILGAVLQGLQSRQALKAKNMFTLDIF